MLSDSFKANLSKLSSSLNLHFEEKALSHVVFEYTLWNEQIAIHVYIEEMDSYIEVEVTDKRDGNFTYTSRLQPNVESAFENIFDFAKEFMTKEDFEKQKGTYLRKRRSLFQRKSSAYSDLIAEMYCNLVKHVYRKIFLP